MSATRRRTLITGAAGGMGRACARLLGATDALVLTDAATGPLAAFAEELSGDGYEVIAAHAGDLIDPALVGTLADLLDGPWALVHLAGLSPALADWRAIVRTNLVATERLLRAIEPRLVPGTAAVLTASMAGHLSVVPRGADAVLADPLAPDLLDRLAPLVDPLAAAAGGIAYALSKAAVIDLAERRAPAWGARGARICTISPGMILTPMGRHELAQTAGAREIAEAAPIGRMGVANDVAYAVRFLLSAEASFVTGCDLKVDGGGVAAVRGAAG